MSAFKCFVMDIFELWGSLVGNHVHGGAAIVVNRRCVAWSGVLLIIVVLVTNRETDGLGGRSRCLFVPGGPGYYVAGHGVTCGISWLP